MNWSIVVLEYDLVLRFEWSSGGGEFVGQLSVVHSPHSKPYNCRTKPEENPMYSDCPLDSIQLRIMPEQLM